MAEAVFAHMVHEAGLQNKIEVDSAGTGDWHIDSAPHPGTMFILQENGIEYTGRGRQIKKEDLNDFDYIITMDEDNLRNVKRLGKGNGQITPLLNFATGTEICEVPDPYFTNGFETVYLLVQAGCTGLLQHIRREHKL